MITFPYLRTKRIAVALRELTLGEAEAVCRIPAERHEAATTALLRFIASAAEAPRPGYVTDPRLWTVGERIRVVAHYMMQLSEDGPDFALGAGRLTDYAMLDTDEDVAPVNVGSLDGVPYTFRPMVGALAEVLEQECTTRAQWVIAAVACQVLTSSDHDPAWADLSDIQILEWVRDRVERLKARTESDFEALLDMHASGMQRTTQFFATWFTDGGIVCLPVSEGGAGLYPARFRAVSCISEATRQLLR